MATNWFSAVFGFSEGNSYYGNKAQFEVLVGGTGGGDPDDVLLLSRGNGQVFHVGPFTVPTVHSLRQQHATLLHEVLQAEGPPPVAAAALPPAPKGASGAAAAGLSFRHVHGDVRAFIRSPDNAGSVFQVASQFNCLEMVGPGVSPDRGIAIYANDPTQGPACALACPAATAYRNYIAPRGIGQGGAGERNQISTMKAVEHCLQAALPSPSSSASKGKGNGEDGGGGFFWTMSNGYLLPTTTRCMARLTALLASKESDLARQVVGNVAVGVHWSTEVHTASKHRVCQVFSSAVPVAYCKSTKSEDWALFARLVLEATFEATLLVASILARRKQLQAQCGGKSSNDGNGPATTTETKQQQQQPPHRVNVFLTAVGGGAFGNRIEWIVEAIQKAIDTCKAEPINVFLVHYGQVVPTQMARLGVPQS